LKSFDVEQFPSGFSNLTYRVRLQLSGRDPLDLVLRRPPFGSAVKSAHDMGREYRILSALEGVYDKSPKPIAHCTDESILDAPFYLMERVEGVILRGKMKGDEAPEAAVMAGIGHSFIRALAELHSLDYAAAGLADLGKPEGYVERQVGGWMRRYEKAKTDEVPDLETAGEWLHDEIDSVVSGAVDSGTGPRASLVHNDFKYDNVVLDPNDLTSVIGVLDWEMTTLGDPLLDLGTTLAYWVDPDDPPALQALRLNPTTLPGNPTRHEVAEMYAESRSITEEHLVFAYVFGLTKIAVIVQQIYYRYQAGYTKDPRFADLIHAVRALGWAASRAIELGRIDRLSR